MEVQSQYGRVSEWLQKLLYTSGVKTAEVTAIGSTFIINKFGAEEDAHANALAAIKALQNEHIIFSNESYFLDKSYTDADLKHQLKPLANQTRFKNHVHAGNMMVKDDKHGHPQLSITLTPQQLNKLEEKFGEHKNKFTAEVKKVEPVISKLVSQGAVERTPERVLNMNSPLDVQIGFFNNIDVYLQRKISSILTAFNAGDVTFSINKEPTQAINLRHFNIKLYTGGDARVKMDLMSELERIFTHPALITKKSRDSISIIGAGGVMASSLIYKDKAFAQELLNKGLWISSAQHNAEHSNKRGRI